MTLGCPLCSTPEFLRPGSDFRPPGRAEGLDDGGSMCPGLAGPGGLALEPWPFLQREYPRAGRKEVGRGGRGGGRKDGTSPSWSEFSRGLAKKRGHLAWPGGEAIGLVTLAGAQICVVAVCVRVCVWGGVQEKRRSPTLCLLVCVTGTRTPPSWAGWEYK